MSLLLDLANPVLPDSGVSVLRCALEVNVVLTVQRLEVKEEAYVVALSSTESIT